MIHRLPLPLRLFLFLTIIASPAYLLPCPAAPQPKPSTLPHSADFDSAWIHGGHVYLAWTDSEGRKQEVWVARKEFEKAARQAETVYCRCCSGCECEDSKCDCRLKSHCSTHCFCKR